MQLLATMVRPWHRYRILKYNVRTQPNQLPLPHTRRTTEVTGTKSGAWNKTSISTGVQLLIDLGKIHSYINWNPHDYSQYILTTSSLYFLLLQKNSRCDSSSSSSLAQCSHYSTSMHMLSPCKIRVQNTLDGVMAMTMFRVPSIAHPKDSAVANARLRMFRCLHTTRADADI